MSKNMFEVLLVEDDPGDADLMREYLIQADMTITLNVVEDGVKALAYLRQEREYVNAIRPCLILLDLNLPKKNGKEVLRDIKGDKRLKRIPVIILTTSDDQKDILTSYDLGANCYVTKPVGIEQYANFFKSLEEFWFTVVTLPVR